LRVLLDTHVLIWALKAPARLPPRLRAAVEDAGTTVFVSAASVWEMAIKRALGRLDFPLERLGEMLRGADLEELPVTHAHAVEAGTLPRHHGDPFDRMLVAQARFEGMALATEDAALRAYEVRLLPE
jgi:PIN domain nuclease of toxin-antitoxin system